MQQLSVIERVQAFYSRSAPPRSRLLLAVSGGGDSVALMHLTARCAEKTGFAELAVAHVNHALRGEESDREETYVRAAARELGLECYVLNLADRERPSSGIEAWARRERYDFFARLAREHGYARVATGHTAEDQAETVLMRLMRGCGTGGLGGIAPQRSDGVIRPLLTLRRGELRAWLNAESITYHEDSSNTDRHYLRNRVRAVLLPFMESYDPGAVELMCSVADAAQEVSAHIAPSVAQWKSAQVRTDSGGSVRIARSAVDGNLVSAQALIDILRERDCAVTEQHLARVLDVARGIRKRHRLPGGWWCSTEREQLVLARGVAIDESAGEERVLAIPGSTEWNGETIDAELVSGVTPEKAVSADGRTVWLDMHDDRPQLVWRTVRAVDRFKPGGTREVGLADFLKKQGLSAAERSCARIVAMPDGTVVWVPGLRVSGQFFVTRESVAVLRLQHELTNYGPVDPER